MLKILMADDHEIVREGLKKIISRTIGMDVVGEASDANQLLALLDRIECDMIILDISMPGIDGLEALNIIKKIHPEIPVLILSMHPEEQYAVRTLQEGASGYICKDSVTEQLIQAIEIVSSGRKFISPKVAENIASMFGTEGDGLPHEKLSAREFQVMKMIARGMTATQIANELFLSRKTISTYRSRILEKLNMKSNAEMTHYAIKNSLV